MPDAPTPGAAALSRPTAEAAALATIRAAHFAELDPTTAYRLWQLRSLVFVVEQDCPYLDLDGRDLEPGTIHLWAEDEPGQALATLRILDDGDVARIGRVVTHPEARGRALAGALLDAALARIGERTSVLDAQAHLASWYARWGFVADGPEFVEDGIPHLPMRRPGQPHARRSRERTMN